MVSYKTHTKMFYGVCSMKKVFAFVSLVMLIFLGLTSCQKKGADKTGENVLTEGEKGQNLALTEEEEKDNWKSFTEIGFKVHMPKEISAKKDNISARIIGNEEDDSDPIYKGYLYRYVSDSANKDFNTIVNDPNMKDEEKREKINSDIRPRVKDIFALVTLRSRLITEENPITKILDTDDIVEVRKDFEYTQVIAFDRGEDVELLSDEEITQYKEFLRISRKILEGAVAGVPVAKKDSLQAITALKFDTVDLEGNRVTDEILQKADITMVNIWATWCPPCRAELPDIGIVEKKYREKSCQVIAICSDVTDEDDSALEEAKDIITNSECEFVVLRKNKSLDAIYYNIQAYPTTLFFDKNGNVVGNVIIGGRSEEEFAKALDEVLEAIKK